MIMPEILHEAFSEVLTELSRAILHGILHVITETILTEIFCAIRTAVPKVMLQILMTEFFHELWAAYMNGSRTGLFSPEDHLSQGL